MIPGRSGNLLQMLDTNNQFSIPLIDKPESDNRNAESSNKLINKHVSESRTIPKQGYGNKLVKAPTHVIKDSNRLDFSGISPMQQLDENEDAFQSPYHQQSNKMGAYIDQSEEGFEEDKLSKGLENQSQNSAREMPRIRGGAVTQGFITNERRRKMDQRRAQKEFEQRNPQSLPYGRNMIPDGVPIHGRYDGIPRQPPFSYHNPYDSQADEQFQKGEQEMNHQMSLPRQSMNQMNFGYGQQMDIRGNEQLRTMSEMMNTMLAFQHNNFKVMIDSHNHIMNKMIDKMCSKKKRNKKSTSESSYRGDDEKEDEYS